MERRAKEQLREHYICEILANVEFPFLPNFLTFKPHETAELLYVLIY